MKKLKKEDQTYLWYCDGCQRCTFCGLWKEKKTHLEIEQGIILVSALNANIHDAIFAENSTLGSELCGKIIPTQKA